MASCGSRFCIIVSLLRLMSVADFEVCRELGRGSYGVVFLCRSKVDENLYVIKQIYCGQMTSSQQRDALSEV
jgi:serine/threonine protein kinase